MHFFSVIVPNYNHEPYLKKRIESILNQTFQDFELIILDDCSTDKSRDIIESYRSHPKVAHAIYNSVNSGSVFRQWKKGMQLATGKYVWVAESDDWAEDNFLYTMYRLINSHNNIGIAFCGSTWVDSYGNKGKDLSIYQVDFIKHGKAEINTLLKYNTIQNASSAVLRSDLAKKYIHTAADLKSCGDWMLYINMLTSSDVVYAADKLNNFRWYHNNVSNAAEKNGNWIKEGLYIVRNSLAYQQRYSGGKILLLYRYWKGKLKEFPGNPRLFLFELPYTFCCFAFKSFLYK